MRVYHFEGSVSAMGEAHGETLREEIHAFYAVSYTHLTLPTKA